jgi:hypothetical protein
MSHIEIFGKPALFTNWLIQRELVPKGWHCYDLRGADRNPGKPVTLENKVGFDHAGTVLSPYALMKPTTQSRRINGTLIFLGEKMGLAEFCEEHDLEFPTDNRKFTLRPALPEEAGLFFALPKEQDAELGAIGHIRMDFGRSGKEFWHTWWPRGSEELNSPEFKAELTELVNELRESGPLKDLSAMYNYCSDYDGRIEGGWRQNYGYVVETEHYRYCLRCSPGQGDYHAYLTAFDLRVQQMNMKRDAPAQEYGLTEAGKQMSQSASDGTLPHSYSWFVYQDYYEKFTSGLTLPEAIRLYNKMDSDNKRLGVTRDGTAIVDFVITQNGKQQFADDYTHFVSFSGDIVIANAAEALRNEITEQAPGLTMGGQTM